MAYNRSGGGMGPWAFILGAIAILVIGIIWYLGAGSPAVEGPSTTEIVVPDAPDVDINNTDIVEPDAVDPVTPAPEAEPLPQGGGTTAPAPAPAPAD